MGDCVDCSCVGPRCGANHALRAGHSDDAALAAYEALYPHRGDYVEKWLERESALYNAKQAVGSYTVDRLLSHYRKCADAGLPLSGPV